MIVLYYVVRMAEAFVMVFCGFFMMTQNYEKRWESKISDFILLAGLLGLSLLNGANGFYYVFADLEYMITILAFMVFMIVFYKISFLLVLAYTLLYWENLLLIHWVAVIVSSILMGESPYVCIYTKPQEQDNFFYVIWLCGIMFGIWRLYERRKEKRFVFSKSKKESIFLVLFLMLEWVLLEKVLFSDDILNTQGDWKSIYISLSFLVIVFSIGMIYIIYSIYLNEKHQAHLVELKYNAVEKQYKYMQTEYEKKSRDIHDAIHKNRLLKEYLISGKINEACQYIDEIQENILKNRVENETGLSVIDFILDAKRREAALYDIIIKTEMDIYYCPLERNELCILLGNLLDNAMEAVKDLRKEKRIIYLKTKTVNNIFLLEVENSYLGKREQLDGKYITTKEEKSIHGMGLESCKLIVKRYEGDLKIEDNGERFQVDVTIYKR